MKTKLSVLSLTATLAIFPGAAAAAVINIDIVRNAAPTPTASNPGYGLWAQGTETWNTSTSITVSNVVDSVATATTVDYAIISTAAIGTNSNTGCPAYGFFRSLQPKANS